VPRSARLLGYLLQGYLAHLGLQELLDPVALVELQALPAHLAPQAQLGLQDLQVLQVRPEPPDLRELAEQPAPRALLAQQAPQASTRTH
jgi:hypothetical protein